VYIFGAFSGILITLAILRAISGLSQRHSVWQQMDRAAGLGSNCVIIHPHQRIGLPAGDDCITTIRCRSIRPQIAWLQAAHHIGQTAGAIGIDVAPVKVFDPDLSEPTDTFEQGLEPL
jgi:hypothetical protein